MRQVNLNVVDMTLNQQSAAYLFATWVYMMATSDTTLSNGILTDLPTDFSGGVELGKVIGIILAFVLVIIVIIIVVMYCRWKKVGETPDTLPHVETSEHQFHHHSSHHLSTDTSCCTGEIISSSQGERKSFQNLNSQICEGNSSDGSKNNAGIDNPVFFDDDSFHQNNNVTASGQPDDSLLQDRNRQNVSRSHMDSTLAAIIAAERDRNSSVFSVQDTENLVDTDNSIIIYDERTAL